jgi:hypothetical protein
LGLQKKKGTAMNAFALKPPGSNQPTVQPARKLRLRVRQWGFAAVYETERRAGLPLRVANAHARFEQEARMAMREWLMV